MQSGQNSYPIGQPEQDCQDMSASPGKLGQGNQETIARTLLPGQTIRNKTTMKVRTASIGLDSQERRPE